ncbi:hypothetical protein MILUP08_41451 [Micromonospora lupini str. Lupac 08]|uniref:Uncharacterized protein n=1 Tax=Micromonospora lupini str. Lupac 08 TaxID=1150864 RepID=I0KY90_9ACTN|nr:hypothetical protein MILUP08_41451 [Micromonospora lupini str. Lupac 08]
MPPRGRLRAGVTLRLGRDLRQRG